MFDDRSSWGKMNQMYFYPKKVGQPTWGKTKSAYLVLPHVGWFSCGFFFLFVDLVLPYCNCMNNYINKMRFYADYFCSFIFVNICIYFMIAY